MSTTPHGVDRSYAYCFDDSSTAKEEAYKGVVAVR